jgi:hypothetical protein
MILAAGQRWRGLTPGSIRTEVHIVEIVEVLEDLIKNPDYPSCRSARVKVVQTDCTVGTFYVGYVYITNFMPMCSYSNKFHEYLPGQDAPID